MVDRETLRHCKEEFDLRFPIYAKMWRYYKGDTDALENYQMITDRANNKVKCNFIGKFIREEAAYVCGNPITYSSYAGVDGEASDIQLNTAHWSAKHDRELCKQALIFNEAYELYYIDAAGRFSSLICTPLNSYVLYDLNDDYGEDTNGSLLAFIRFFYRRFDDSKTQYADVYSSDGTIAHYTVSGTEFLPVADRITRNTVDNFSFSRVPVGIVKIGTPRESLYSTLKGLQDGYETNLSDIVNEISDFRNAYLTFAGCKLDEDQLKTMKKNGIMNLPNKESVVQWLVKNVNDSFVQNTLNTLEDKIYQLSSHINNNEKMVSNASSLALRNRLIGLEQACTNNIAAVTDAIKTRVQLLFETLAIKTGTAYDWRDVRVKFTPCIPTDDLMVAQILSQLKGMVSLRTGLAQLSFVDNPEKEIERLQKEQSAEAVGAGLLAGASPGTQGGDGA